VTEQGIDLGLIRTQELYLQDALTVANNSLPVHLILAIQKIRRNFYKMDKEKY
jgi:hypothetical protein